MLSKINKYLLENRPSWWHLQVPFLVMTGVGLHLFSLLYAFLYLNTYTISKVYGYDFMSNSYFVFFHSIFLLIIACIWGLNFFKHSIIKNYYPASSWYLPKLFLGMMFLFFLNISSYLSFELGINWKKKYLVHKYQMEEVVEKFKFFEPLYLVDSYNYSLDRNTELNNKYIDFQFLGDKTSLHYGTKEAYDIAIKEGRTPIAMTDVDSIPKELISYVDGKKAIFYNTVTIKDSANCDLTLIRKFIKLSGYSDNDLRNHPNYSKELELALQNPKQLVQDWVEFNQQINKIYPFTNVNPWLNVKYLLGSKGKYFNCFVNSYKDYYNHPSGHTYASLSSLDEEIDFKILNKTENNYFYFEEYAFDQMSSNIQLTNNTYYIIFGCLVASAALAYLLIQFQYIAFTNFAIAVPVVGVAVIAGVFFCILTYTGLQMFSVVLYLGMLLTFIVMIFNGSDTLKVRLKELLIFLMAFVLPILIMITYGALSEFMYKELITRTDHCGIKTSYNEFRSPAFFEYHFLIFGLITQVFFLYRVKRLITKQE